MSDASLKVGAAAGPQPRPLSAGRSPSGDHFYRRLIIGLSIGFLAILLTLLVLGLALDHNHRAVGGLVGRIITIEEPTSAAAYEMEINIIGAGSAVVKYMATGDPQHRERVKKDQEDFHRFKLQYDRLTETAPEKELGRQIDALYERYRAVGDTLMDARDQQAALGACVAEAFARIDEIIDDQIQASMELTQADHHAKFQESASIEGDVAEVGTWLGNYLTTSKPDYRERIFDNLQDVRGHLAAFQKLALNALERQWIGQLELLFQQTVTDIDKILGLHDSIRRDEAEFIHLQGQLDDLLDEGVQALTRRDLAAVQTQTSDTIQRLHRASLVLLAVCVLVCVAAAAVIILRSVRLHKEMKLRQVSETTRDQLLEQLVSTQEEERGRLARELHDQLGQHLSALVLGLKGLDRSSEAGPSAGSQRLQQLGDWLIEKLRTIAWELRPAALDDLGLHGALCTYVEDWTRRSGLPVDFHSELQDQRLPGRVETTLYRVAQEALTNIMKHAQARFASLLLQRRGHEVVMVVEDDGQGFAPEKVPPPSSSDGRLGLPGMKERIKLVGGVLEVESAPGAGTTLIIRIPVGTTEPHS